MIAVPRIRHWTLAALVGLSAASPAAAQQPTQPLSGRQVQTLLQNSGLTVDQIRSRLKAQGLQESMLDNYLSGDASAAPDPTVFAAVRALGLSDPAAETAVASAGNRTLLVQSEQQLEKQFLDSVSALAKDAELRNAVLGFLASKDLRRAELDRGLAVFGLDAFRRENTLFAPSDLGPVPPDYRVGPGDELILILTGDTERSHQLAVTREGMIFIPNVGAVAVASLTMRQLEDVLWARLGRVYSGLKRGAEATAHFQVTVAKLGANQVSVLGDVARPGSYRISKLGTVLTALYQAGGPTESGNFRRVEVKRGGKPVATLDLYDYLISGNSTNDVRIESGDIILVPARGARVRIAGAVIRPATYELKERETLGDLVKMAGGFRPEADRRRVQVERLVPPERRAASGTDRVLFDVASAFLEASSEPVLSGDIVTVATVATHVANRVVVSGNVWSPGDIALTPGMRVADAIARAGGTQPDTYMDAVQLSRLQADSTRRMMRLSLVGRSVGETMRGDTVSLQPDDQIRVFSLSEYRPMRQVMITGAVRSGGAKPFTEGMTLRDLLMLAGGLAEGALLTEAEVARMPADRKSGATAVTVRVALDSTYLFDRMPGGTYQGPPGVAAATRGAPEFELKAYDNVLVLQQPDWLAPRRVNVAGQVRYPGDYTLRSKSETLVDLIERAGGLTADAYPQGIVFRRAEDQVGRIGIDLLAAMRRKDHPDNVLLADADSITIPFRSSVVLVRGEVNSPVAVPFQRGENLKYYINGAGGPSARAAVKRAYVLQPGGKVESRHRVALIFSSIPEPQPGSVISVPEAGPRRQLDVPTILAALTSMFTSTIAMVAILKRT